MDKLWEASLDPSSPRYHDWKQILQTDTVPIKSASAFEATLGLAGEKDKVYLLDIMKLSQEQYRRLVEWACKKYDADSYEVEEQLRTQGFPIRSSDVIVAFSLRAFL